MAIPDNHISYKIRKAVLQYDGDGNLIQEHVSVRKAVEARDRDWETGIAIFT